VTDDSDALIKAYDYVMNKLRRVESRNAQNSEQNSYILYLPAGEYLVTKPIVFSEDYVWMTNPVGQRMSAAVFLRWIGESRESTVIRLKDHSPGFQERVGEPVLSLERMDFNNSVAYHSIRHLTVNIGKGNPGAAGIRYAGANNSGIRDVAVISEDGSGHTGILCNVETSMGYWQDILVDGFDRGLIVSPAHMTHISLEYVTFRNQKQAGIVIDHGSVSGRKLKSENTVPALWINGSGGYAHLLDCTFTGGTAEHAAMSHADGVLVARDVRTSGYRVAIQGPGLGYRMYRDGAEMVSGPDIKRYIGGKTFGRNGISDPDFLDLDIEDSPLVPYEPDPERWASPDDFGAVGDGKTDDTDAVQAAVDSGASTIYFPKRIYRINGTVRIPEQVERLNFLYARLVGRNRKSPMFTLSGKGGSPLVLEDLRCRGLPWFFEHATPRDVVMRHVGVQGIVYRNTNQQKGVRLFLENVNGLGRVKDQFGNQQKVWARFINTEYKKGPNFDATDCDMWVFGYKYEGGEVNFWVDDGGRLEIVGGIANQFGSKHHPSDVPVIHIEDGEASVSLVTNGPSVSHQGYEVLVEDFGGESPTILRMEDAPFRKFSDHFLPLYSTRGRDEDRGE